MITISEFIYYYSLYVSLKDYQPQLKFLEELTNHDVPSAEHQAGFDAFLTGTVYLSLLKRLCKNPNNYAEFTSKFENKIHMHRCTHNTLLL